MDVATLTHHPADGWSAPFPDLDGDDTLVLAFGAPAYADRPEALAELAAAYPRSIITGCSTAGEINGDRLTDNSLSVAIGRFSHAHLRAVSSLVEDPARSRDAARQLAEQLDSPELRGVLVFSDGLQVNGSELARGLNDHIAGSVPVTGGLAGDGERFESTWVIHDGAPCSRVVTAVGLYGSSLRIGSGSRGGWDIFGPERLITRARGNVLYELDGKPALELYRSYLGDLADELPASALRFPLAVRSTPDDTQQVVRTILAMDEATQSLTFAGDVPEGSHAQLMRANPDRLVDGAARAADMACPDDSAAPATLSVAISCVGRRLVLGARTEDELESVLEMLPANTTQIGFYSYGELSPFESGACDLHNQTMTLTTISEAA